MKSGAGEGASTSNVPSSTRRLAEMRGARVQIAPNRGRRCNLSATEFSDLGHRGRALARVQASAANEEGAARVIVGWTVTTLSAGPARSSADAARLHGRTSRGSGRNPAPCGRGCPARKRVYTRRLARSSAGGRSARQNLGSLLCSAQKGCRPGRRLRFFDELRKKLKGVNGALTMSVRRLPSLPPRRRREGHRDLVNAVATAGSRRGGRPGPRRPGDDGSPQIALPRM